MTITKKLEAEIKEVMNDYWNAYFEGNLDHWGNYLAEDYRNIGGNQEEIWNSKSEIIDYTKRIIDQMQGATELRNKQTQIIPYDPYFMVHELLDIFIKVDSEWTFYQKFRLSSLIQKTPGGWKVLHQHGSYPDSKTSEGEAFAFNTLKSENIKLQKAISEQTVELEYKNRELQIEASLERVRSRTMAMHKSEEVMDVAGILFRELKKLGFAFGASSIIIMDKESGDAEYWLAGFNKEKFPESYQIKYFQHPYHDTLLSAWKASGKFLVYTLAREEKKAYDEVLFTQTGYKNIPEEEQKLMREKESVTFSIAFMKHGALHWGPSPLNEEQTGVLQRVAKVFEQAYTRFLDLQKAEAQAREAEIELALEKVRSKGMAMQNSNELAVIVDSVFKELTRLDVSLDRCIIMIYDLKTFGSTWWLAHPEPEKAPVGLFVKYHEYKPYLDFINAWKARKLKWEYLLEGRNKKEWDEFIFAETELSRLPAPVIAGMKSFDSIFLNVSFNNFGCLTVSSAEPIPEEQLDILLRFAKVFDSTYTRFNDLKQAEAQAKEAQIEAALEKVRSTSLAMHHSTELEQVAGSLFDRLVELGLSFDGALIFVFDKEKRNISLWIATNHLSAPVKIDLPYDKAVENNTIIKDLWHAIENGEHIINRSYSGAIKNEYFRYVAKNNEAKIPEAIRQIQIEKGSWTIHLVAEKNSMIGFDSWSGHPAKEEDFKILIRFAKVFEQAFTRFLDLQKAEAQAREAQIELGLERVRARAMAMQHTDELADAAQLLYHEFGTLGIKSFTCGYMFIDVEKNIQTVWAVLPDGTLLPNFIVFPLIGEHILDNRYKSWKRKEPLHIADIKGEENKAHHRFLSKHVPTSVAEDFFSHIPDRIIFYSANFSYGYLLILSTESFSSYEEQTIIRFAKVFEQTYTRFLDLQKAEAQAEQALFHLIQIEAEKLKAETALIELQATQKQLIQSEKMASLGELTAGIAHEIQNPLNFVNNFSEVSMELIEEVKSEKLKAQSERDEQLETELLDDITQNLEKIAHHGKRADSIVKGMLQHSRASSGDKQPTNLNMLADEFLKLSYHGLRAKDKSFNAELVTNFDESLPMIDVVQQDIGRVLLNLFNNAFYAVQEKRKAESEKPKEDYRPTVEVSTSVKDGFVVITVRDNGFGIPEGIKDKIMQPFFTTKPTGEGTGLGLSLSYDILKTHGGEIKVETEEGEYTEFSIIMPSKPILVA